MCVCVGKQHHNSPLQIKAHVWIVSRTKPQKMGFRWSCMEMCKFEQLPRKTLHRSSQLLS